MPRRIELTHSSATIDTVRYRVTGPRLPTLVANGKSSQGTDDEGFPAFITGFMPVNGLAQCFVPPANDVP
jgi:hypothetical protein